jgi:hypothetical protein
MYFDNCAYSPSRFHARLACRRVHGSLRRRFSEKISAYADRERYGNREAGMRVRPATAVCGTRRAKASAMGAASE